MTATTHPTNDAADSRGRPAGGGAAPRWTVLLVDDEPDILGSIKMLLERSKKGVKVVTAPSGTEALQMLREAHFDLLISDFKMPVMDGIEFLAKARELRPELPRVMFTAHADADLARRAFAEAFVHDFLPKTLAPKQLVEKVESLLDGLDESEDFAGGAGQGAADPVADDEGVRS